MADRKENQTISTGQTIRKAFGRLYAHSVGRFIGQPAWSLWARAALAARGAAVGLNLSVRGRLRLNIQGRLTIGKDVRFCSGRSNFVGGDRRMAMWVGQDGHLDIGDGCALSNSTICCARSVVLLPHTFIGGGCEIYDMDFHQLDAEDRILNRGEVPSGEIRIGPKAFVGAWSIILKNVTIGEGAVIGAGSVVTRSVPPHEIWAGVPAAFIRKLKDV